jgi:hypothetical protein
VNPEGVFYNKKFEKNEELEKTLQKMATDVYILNQKGTRRLQEKLQISRKHS